MFQPRSRLREEHWAKTARRSRVAADRPVTDSANKATTDSVRPANTCPGVELEQEKRSIARRQREGEEYPNASSVRINSAESFVQWQDRHKTKWKWGVESHAGRRRNMPNPWACDGGGSIEPDSNVMSSTTPPTRPVFVAKSTIRPADNVITFPRISGKECPRKRPFPMPAATSGFISTLRNDPQHARHRRDIGKRISMRSRAAGL